MILTLQIQGPSAEAKDQHACNSVQWKNTHIGVLVHILMRFDHVTGVPNPLSAILSVVILRAMSETILHMNVSVTADTLRSPE